MPETRLSEIVNALDDQEFQIKMAAVEQAYEGDEVRQELLAEAVELLKVAEADGDVDPMSDSAMLSTAVQLVEDHLNGDEGGEEETEEGGEVESEEEAEELYNLGAIAGEAMKTAGISLEDLDNVSGPEEAEQLGRLAARIAAESEE